MRSDFIRMSYITMDLSDIERERRIRAFHVPGYRNKVHVKVGDRYFIYDPVFDARMRKKKNMKIVQSELSLHFTPSRSHCVPETG